MVQEISIEGYFSLDQEIQSRLEETVRKIISKVHYLCTYQDIVPIFEKSAGDEQINLDTAATEIIFKDYSDIGIFTEEGEQTSLTPELIVADPIDGSSEANRMGPYSNPLSTSIMLIRDNKIIGAAAGDIWKKRVYGINNNGLYWINPDHKDIRTYVVCNKRDQQIRLAAYARTSKYAKVAQEIFRFVELGVISYFGNDGGGMFPIEVALGRERGYNCAAELLPVPLYEHITAIMATKAGAKLSRLDGTPLEINHEIKQTSIVAANDSIRETLIQRLKDI